MAFQLFIGGTERSLRAGSLSISHVANGRSAFSCDVTSQDGSWRPSVGDKIGLIEGVSIPGGARSFNGSTSVAARSYSDTTVNNWTMGCWVRPDTTSAANRVPFAIGRDATNGYGFVQRASNYWAGLICGVAFIGDATYTAVADEWVFLTLRRSSGTLQFYVNGEAVGATSASVPVAPNSSSYWQIGAIRNAADNAYILPFDGDVAWAFFTNNVLTVSAMRKMYNGGPGGIGISPDQFDPGNFFRTYPLEGDATEDDTDGANALTLTSVSTVADGPKVMRSSETAHFSGSIESTVERGAGSDAPTSHIVTSITAVDFNGIPDQRYVSGTYASATMKSRITSIVADYLDDYDIEVDINQANGPTLEAASYDYALSVTEVLNEISRLSSGYVWNISPLKVLTFTLASGDAAPFSVTTANRNSRGDMTVERSRTRKANRVIVQAGLEKVLEKTESFTGNGSTSSWPLTYTRVSDRGYVTANGNFETLSTVAGTAQWRINTSTNTLVREAGNLTNGHVVTIVYDAQFPHYVQADDAGDQATNGIIESFIRKPDVYDNDEAQAIADAEVALLVDSEVKVTYRTYETGLLVGQTQTITVAERSVNASCLITEIRISDEIDRLVYEVSAKSVGFASTWRDMWARLGA